MIKYKIISECISNEQATISPTIPPNPTIWALIFHFIEKSNVPNTPKVDPSKNSVITCGMLWLFKM